MRVVGQHAQPQAPALGIGVGTHGHDEQEGRAVGEVQQVLRQGARRRVRPVHVVERQDDRLLGGERLEPGRVGLAWRRAGRVVLA